MDAAQVRETCVLLEQYLIDSGHPFLFHEDDLLWEVSDTGFIHPFTRYYKLYDQEHELALHLVADFATPTGRDEDVVEYLTRTNLALVLGAFEYHYEEATIRFKSSLGFRGNRVTTPLIAHMSTSAMTAWDRYLPGAVEVMLDVESPAAALLKITSAAD